MSDQYPPYRPEGQPNQAGWNDPWPTPGESSTPHPQTPPPGAGGAGQPSNHGGPGGPGAPWDPAGLDNAPTHLVTPPGGPSSAGQSGGWQNQADGSHQPGGWPTGPDGGQGGWGPPQPGTGNPPSWPQQPHDPQQWQPSPDNMWSQQPPGGGWSQQTPQPQPQPQPQPFQQSFQQQSFQQQHPNPGQQPGYDSYQQGWPQPQPGGQQPGGKKLNPAFVVAPLALVAAIVLGIVIALVVRDGDEDANALPPIGEPAVTNLPDTVVAPGLGESQAPAPATGGAPPGAPDCTPLAPVGGPPATGPEPVYDIGQTAHVVSDDEYDISDFQANVTVNSICTQTTAFDDWSDPPVQGLWVLADVTVEVLSGEVSAIYLDFSVQTADGARYDGDYPPIEPRLDEFDLVAGNTVRGFVLVDAPPGNHLLRWEPSFATSVGLWRF